ncbi:Isochorismatase hydrolase [Paraphaeosphaeria sporulosa]|uniref:Isochorismatase hydrolase n=1 Tax=Paraphaeosphaeria sporulosa TaxID=1460663 RepID=A0A177BZU4_9PLEO|nr:Isochorismatase hydrolase [Paraphaeosphaeria sporulosa]OAF99966.1 Isochorismatase hydrolase [Paraphaeosphaeria sporulosa]
MASPPIDAPSHYPASQTALLLLDFHSMFVENLADGKGQNALSIAASTKVWAKSKNIEIIHCLIDADQTPYPTCKNVQRFASIISSFKSGGKEEPAALREDAGDEKTFLRRGGYVSALKSPGLAAYLREKGIVSLVLAGLSTSGCVLRTAAAACDDEFVVTVLEDGCADNDQDVHDALIRKVLPGRGYVYTAEAFREGWENGTLGL